MSNRALRRDSSTESYGDDESSEEARTSRREAPRREGPVRRNDQQENYQKPLPRRYSDDRSDEDRSPHQERPIFKDTRREPDRPDRRDFRRDDRRFEARDEQPDDRARVPRREPRREGSSEDYYQPKEKPLFRETRERRDWEPRMARREDNREIDERRAPGRRDTRRTARSDDNDPELPEKVLFARDRRDIARREDAREELDDWRESRRETGQRREPLAPQPNRSPNANTAPRSPPMARGRPYREDSTESYGSSEDARPTRRYDSSPAPTSTPNRRGAPEHEPDQLSPRPKFWTREDLGFSIFYCRNTVSTEPRQNRIDWGRSTLRYDSDDEQQAYNRATPKDSNITSWTPEKERNKLRK